MINIQGVELYLSDFISKMFEIGLCSDIYEQISFKLIMMVGMTKLYILIPVQMTLTVTQEKAKLVQSYLL